MVLAIYALDILYSLQAAKCKHNNAAVKYRVSLANH